MIELDIKYLSCKIKRKEKKKNRSYDGENHYVAVSKPKKVKRMNICEAENLSKVSKDEVLDHLPSYFRDRSLVLIKKTQEVNLGVDEAP